jgi:hypothetical protein
LSDGEEEEGATVASPPAVAIERGRERCSERELRKGARERDR